MVNRCCEQNLAYVMLVQLKGLTQVLFLIPCRIDTVFFSVSSDVFIFELLKTARNANK